MEVRLSTDCCGVPRDGLERDRGDRESLLDGCINGYDSCGGRPVVQQGVLGLSTARGSAPLVAQIRKAGADDG